MLFVLPADIEKVQQRKDFIQAIIERSRLGITWDSFRLVGIPETITAACNLLLHRRFSYVCSQEGDFSNPSLQPLSSVTCQ
jgi:hypothetical protein